MWLWIRMCFALVKRGYQKYHHNILPWPPMPNSICFEFHFFFLFRVCVAQPPSDTDWDSLAVFSHFNFLSRHCFASYPQHLAKVRSELVSWSDISLPLSPSSVLLSLLSVGAQTEMKKVVGDNATLPCHHQFPSSSSLDIEWLLQKPNSKQKVVR